MYWKKKDRNTGTLTPRRIPFSSILITIKRYCNVVFYRPISFHGKYDTLGEVMEIPTFAPNQHWIIHNVTDTIYYYAPDRISVNSYQRILLFKDRKVNL